MDWQVKANWQSVPALQAMPVQSAILKPLPGEQLNPDASGCIEVAGYAWSGGGTGISRVEVTADGGATWVSANIQNPGGVQQPAGRAWAWVFWKARVPVVSEGVAAKMTAAGQAVNAAMGADVRSGDSSSANDGGRGLPGPTQQGKSSSSGNSDEKPSRGGLAGPAAEKSSTSGERVVVLQCKAVDGQYNSQPSDVGSIWNIRGCGCNTWHAVEVTVS